MSTAPARRKIAILGGGIGALTAAFELTEQPNWRDHYDITVYQVGWRLGGKAASGRNLREGFGKRSEEHGFHVFFGSYENAFFLLGRAYRALRRAPQAPLRSLKQAFHPHDVVVWAEPDEENARGRSVFWAVPYPRRGGMPGELAQRFRHPSRLGSGRAAPPTIRQLVLTWMDVGLRQTLDSRFAPPLWLRAWVLLTALILGIFRGFGAKLLLGLEQGIVRRRASHLGQRIDDPAARHLWLELRTAEVVFDGLIQDRVFDRGFDVLDHMEFRDWLRDHGATDDLLDSPLVRVGYDAAFAFASGHRVPGDAGLIPSLGAGTALRGALRLYAYRHAGLWKMQAGMGEVVVMPLYEVLRQRGVNFKFFQRVTALEASDHTIERIRVVPQVRLAGGRAEYEPTVTIKGLPCWPSEPLYDQIADGQALQAEVQARPSGEGLECPPWLHNFEQQELTLVRGEHFDDVVLGISVGGLEEISRDLAARDERWSQMLKNVATSPTLAFQLWLKKSVHELGWDTHTFPQPVVSGLVEPVDTWADSTQLVAREDWGAQPVRSIAYFCGPLPGSDDQDPHTAFEAVCARGVHFVEAEAQVLWPGADPTTLLENLVAPDGCQGQARLAAQHWRANVSGTARYVQSRPGTTRFRLPSDTSGFTNLFLAGDWTRNGLNAGCAEAAVMSGMQAARGIARRVPGSTPITVWGEADRC